jgi:hypothetical protein
MAKSASGAKRASNRVAKGSRSRRKSRETSRPRAISRHERGIYQIANGNLFDLLSEMLVLEKNSLHLLILARDRSPSAEIRESLEQYVEDCERQVDALQTVIRDLGGNPVYVSPSAQIQYQRASSASQIISTARLQQLSDIENCWYAALQENLHLAFLRSIIPFLQSLHAQDTLADVFEESGRVQELRLEWLENTLHRLLL